LHCGAADEHAALRCVIDIEHGGGGHTAHAFGLTQAVHIAGANADPLAHHGLGQGVARARGASDINIVNNQQFTLKLQGSTDNFSSSTVDLYTSGTLTPTTNYVKDVQTGITTTTAYRYHRIYFTAAGGAPDTYVAELEFTELA
jgi:hypothetical protein